MPVHNAHLHTAVAQALATMGLTAPIDAITAEPLNDAPGFHWANPGVRTLHVTAGGALVDMVKRLQPRSRREVLVYRALDHLEGAFMPRLWSSGYVEPDDDYWLLIERGVPRHLPEPPQFHAQCGLVLARIHAACWDRTADLPNVFHLPRPPERAWRAVVRLRETLHETGPALNAFCADERAVLLDRLATISCDDLPAKPPRARCLIHAAFHAPEITWRDTDAIVPLAVDWETARVGAPEEDFDVAGSLWVQGDDVGVDVLFDAYLAEMAAYGISLDRARLVASIREQTWIRKIEIMSWLAPQFIKVRDDPAYAKWCTWARGSLRDTLVWLARETA